MSKLDMKATWRIAYRRSMSDKKARGTKKKDYFKFVDDVDWLADDYYALLEFKIDGDDTWFIAGQVHPLLGGEHFTIVDENGQKLVNTTFTKRFMKEYFKNNPSYNELLHVASR